MNRVDKFLKFDLMRGKAAGVIREVRARTAVRDGDITIVEHTPAPHMVQKVAPVL